MESHPEEYTLLNSAAACVLEESLDVETFDHSPPNMPPFYCPPLSTDASLQAHWQGRRSSGAFRVGTIAVSVAGAS